MRILHSADWHLGELTGPVLNGENARLLDTVRCLDFLVEKAEQEQPDAILVAGDLGNKSQMWASPMLNLIDIAASRLRRLAAVAPTVLMFGTTTHDSIEAFNNINSMQIIDLYVVTTPKLFALYTKSGPLQVAAIPGLDKGHFRAQYPGIDPTEENAMCSKLLGDIVLGMGTQIDPPIPSVLISHYTVAGCEYDNGQVSIFNNSEVILPREALAASPFDLVCLGHIHKAQEVDNCGAPTFYSGPPNGLTFNEEGQRKGFWLHEIVDTQSIPDLIEKHRKLARVHSRFIKTPSREFLTLTMDEYDVQVFISQGAAVWWEPDPDGATYYPSPTGKIVRVHYSCSDELNKQLRRKALEKALYDAGAFYVAEIKPIQITTALSKQEMTENAGPLENLAKWAEGEGHGTRMINALAKLAQPLVEMVSAKMPTGKLAGVFVPKRIEVRNYRSYREESFDFTNIVFATVNGPNGVGKSALFMDALCDCLFEDPREGDLTGWISNDVKAKSGMITFEFGMGQTDWRVIRTRVKSGKTTLALQELVDGQWVDRGADKKDDTQAKIIAILGMDAMTLRCCGLIMQDAYGLFLEADKSDRMEVLGNILGLGIYEQLTELAKAKVTETNRNLTSSKEKLAALHEKLKAVPVIEKDMEAVRLEIDQVTKEIADREKVLAEIEDAIRQLETKPDKAADFQKQIDSIEQEVGQLKTEKASLESKKDTAQKKLDAEEQIQQKADEYDQIKQKVAVLQTKNPRLTELGTEENRLAGEIGRTEKQLLRLAPHIREVEHVLENRGELEKATAEYQNALQEDERLNGLAEKDKSFKDNIMAIERSTDKAWESIESNRRHLNTLIERAAMLLNSDCIDPERASCAFLADAQKCKKQVPELEKTIDQQVKDRDKLLEQVAALEKERDSLGYDSRKHAQVKSDIKTLRPKAEQAAQLEVKAQLLKTLRGQKKQLEEQKTGLDDQLKKAQDEANTLAAELEPLAGMEERLPKLEAWVRAKDELPACREIVRASSERIGAIDLEVARKKEVKAKLSEERAALLEEAQELVIQVPARDAEAEKIRELRDKLSQLNEKAGGLKAQLDAMATDAEKRQQIADDMEPQANLLVQYQTLAKAFSMDGVPFSIVRAVVPELSAMANEILADMTGGKMSLEMRTERVQKSNKKEVNALEIWINDYQRGSLPYKSRSGGQKVKAALSVAFALADLKARRAGIQLGMMFVDEPPFLDGEGTEAYCDALMTMSQRFSDMKVIAISHDPRIKARFPQIIDVIDAGEEGSKVRLIA